MCGLRPMFSRPCYGVQCISWGFLIVTSCWVWHNHEQRQFSELLLKAAGDYGALTAATTDIQWTQNFKEPPSVWGVRTLLPSCTVTLYGFEIARDNPHLYEMLTMPVAGLCLLAFLWLNTYKHITMLIKNYHLSVVWGGSRTTESTPGLETYVLWLGCRSYYDQFQQHWLHAHAITRLYRRCVMQCQLFTEHASGAL